MAEWLNEYVAVPRELLLRAAALLSERLPCADSECRVADDGAGMKCYDELCAAARGVLGTPAPLPVADVVMLSGKVASCRERAGHGLPDGPHALYAAPTGVMASDDWQQYAKKGETAHALGVDMDRGEQPDAAGLYHGLAHEPGEVKPCTRSDARGVGGTDGS